MFGNIGTTEIVLIVLAVLLLFGGKKLPDLAKGIGRGIREFKKEVNDVKENVGSLTNFEETTTKK